MMIATLKRMQVRARRAGYVWAHGRLTGNGGVFRPHGIDVTVDERADLALRYLLARGRPYEAPEARLIRAHVAPGTDVIELGGCIGIVSATIRDRIGPDARHILVEANPDIAPLALANATGPQPDRTELVQAAVDYSGASHVRFARGHNQHVGHVARGDEDGFDAPAVTLANLAARLPGRFALVSDIEGAETAMIAAEVETLRRCDAVVLEVHPAVYGYGEAGVDAITETLARAGLHRIEREQDVIAYGRALDS
ncbi:FkbM family methyltransferase [Jannaschia sp. KMU-145]|uniref:FkbM family methyltransferase n=1 Tax=Jannaschia halovivens TaxID=3388667 RepID=UPI00396B2704